MPQPSTTQTKTSTASPMNGDLAKTKDAVVEGAQHLTEEVKHVAAGAASQAKKTAESKLDAGRDFAAEHLGTVADALRKTGEELRTNDSALTEYVGQAATAVDSVSNYLQTRTLSQLMGDLEGFARREPALFLGGSFVAGLVGGRFLKSATPARAQGQPGTAKAQATHALPAYAGHGVNPAPTGRSAVNYPGSFSGDGVMATKGAGGASASTSPASTPSSASPRVAESTAKPVGSAAAKPTSEASSTSNGSAGRGEGESKVGGR